MKRILKNSANIICLGTGESNNLERLGLCGEYKLNQEGKFIGLIEEITKKGNLERAYIEIKSKPGNMTPGGERETLEGISKGWMKRTRTQINKGTYTYGLKRRIEIPKKGGGMRPLTMPAPRDKIVETVIAKILESILEPIFLETSHGFRPNRGTKTAIQRVVQKFKPCTFIIEGDIKACFPSMDHRRLEKFLKEHIADEAFIKLVMQIQKAVEDGERSEEQKKGIGQGSTISPILSNLYLHRLDQWIEQEKIRYDYGKEKRKNLEYYRIQKRRLARIHKLDNLWKNKPNREKVTAEMRTLESEIKKLRQEMRKLPSRDQMDPTYRRLTYVRYADDWLIGIAGPHKETKVIKERVAKFLKENLGLNLSKEKTKITNIKKKTVKFLGYLIRSPNPRGNRVTQGRRQYPEMRTYMPSRDVMERLVEKKYAKWRKNQKTLRPTGLGWLTNLSHNDIVKHYNSVMKGLSGYYDFVDNRNAMSGVYFILNHSLALTLAQKYRLTSRRKAYQKFGKDLKCPTTGIKLSNLYQGQEDSETRETKSMRKPSRSQDHHIE